MYSDAPDFPLSLFLNQEVYCIISAHSHYQFIWKTLTQARIKMKGGDVQRLHGPALISAHWLVGSLSSFFFFSLRFFCSRWCGKFSLSLCQIHFQDDFLAQLQSVTRSPITGRKERDGELYTPPHSVNIISRQFVLHNLTPSVKKCGARGEERREESGLLCSWCHFSYWSWVVK